MRGTGRRSGRVVSFHRGEERWGRVHQKCASGIREEVRACRHNGGMDERPPENPHNQKEFVSTIVYLSI